MGVYTITKRGEGKGNGAKAAETTKTVTATLGLILWCGVVWCAGKGK